MHETPVDSWVRKICWRRVRLPTPGFLGFPCGSDGKESTCNVEDLGSIPGLERSPGKGKGSPFQYSALENSKDTVHGVAKNRARLSDFHFHFKRKASVSYRPPALQQANPAGLQSHASGDCIPGAGSSGWESKVGLILVAFWREPLYLCLPFHLWIVYAHWP